YCGKDVFPDAVFGLMTEDEVKGMAVVKEMPKAANQGLNGLREKLQVKNDEQHITDAEIVLAPEDILSEIPPEEEAAEIVLAPEDILSEIPPEEEAAEQIANIESIIIYDNQDKSIPVEPLTGIEELKRLISGHKVKDTSIKAY